MNSWFSRLGRLVAGTPERLIVTAVVVLVMAMVVDPSLGRELLARTTNAVFAVVNAFLPLAIVLIGIGVMVRGLFRGGGKK